MTRILALAIALTTAGCSTVQPIGQQPVPEQFLADCVAAKREIRTNGDLAAALLDHKEALAACNLDKQAIRRWSDGLTGAAK